MVELQEDDFMISKQRVAWDKSGTCTLTANKHLYASCAACLCMGASLVCLLRGISDLGGKISNLGGGIFLQKTGNAVADVNGELLVSQ